MKIYAKKNGQWALSVTGKWIITLISMAVVLFITKGLSEAMDTGYNKMACKSSVVTNAQFKTPVIGTTTFEVNCPTRYAVFGIKEVTISSGKKGDEVVEKIKISCQGDPEDEKFQKCYFIKVNQVISDLMYDCWDQFGVGRLNVFSEISTKSKCLICSTVEFDDEAKKKLGSAYTKLKMQDVDETTGKSPYLLDEYMRAHGPPLHESISYYEFVLDEPEDSYQLPFYDYSLDEIYAIIFKTEYSSKFKELHGKAGTLVECGGRLVLSAIDVADPCKDDILTELSKDDIIAANANSFVPLSKVKPPLCEELK